MGPDAPPQQAHYDALLGDILAQEGNNLSAFLNTVFGFLSRRCPEEAFGSGGGGGHITGEHLVSQSYCRWKQRYQEQQAEEELRQAVQRESDGIPEAVVEEEVCTHTEEAPLEDGEAGSRPSNPSTPGQSLPSHNEGGQGRQGNKGSHLDTTNGAALDGLAWTQTIDDLEVWVVVPPSVTRGKQVKVKVRPTSLTVAVKGVPATVTGVSGGGSPWHTLLEGTLPHPVRAEESLWSLVSTEHVSIHLEKCEERWWDRLLTQHDPIDLQKISAERDYGSLPEEDRSKIQELMWSKWQKDQGKPTLDQLRMESVLRQAWTAEGSPFLGRPFDPSSVTVVGGQGFPGT